MEEALALLDRVADKVATTHAAARQMVHVIGDKHSRLQGLIVRQQGVRDGLTRIVGELQTSVHKLMRAVRDKEQQLKALREQNSRADLLLRGLERTKAKLTKDYHRLTTEIKTHTSDLSVLQRDIAIMTAAKSQLKAQVGTARAHRNRMWGSVLDATAKVHTLGGQPSGASAQQVPAYAAVAPFAYDCDSEDPDEL